MERDEYVIDSAPNTGDFNSHAHVERDQSGIELAFTKDISTHTLTWSVTISKLSAVKWTKHFNSHAHVERDYPQS